MARRGFPGRNGLDRAVALGVALCAAVAVAGCGTTAPPPSPVPMVVGHAGMLTALVRQGLAPALAARGVEVRSVPGNSLTVAGNIKNGTLPADLFGSADANANRLLMGPANGDKVRWFAVIARNAVVLAYSPKSRFLADFERARRGESRWYEPLLRPGVTLGRDNPDTDPLGSYDLFVGQLAEDLGGPPGLRHRIFGEDRNPAQVGNADLGKLRDGAVDAMFMYASGASAGGVPYLQLPPEINLSDPAYAAGYAKASFTNASGVAFRGGVINASIAPVEGSPNGPAAVAALEYLFSADGQRVLREQGFLPSPVLVGGDLAAVPERLRPAVQGSYPSS